jgi:hypothetical protein
VLARSLAQLLTTSAHLRRQTWLIEILAQSAYYYSTKYSLQGERLLSLLLLLLRDLSVFAHRGQEGLAG